jgi:hypothetical protein
VIDEAQDGKRRGVLVQALIEEVEPPYGFRQIQWADLTSWTGDVAAPTFKVLRDGIGRFLSPTASEILQESRAGSPRPAQIPSASAGQSEDSDGVSPAGDARIRWLPIDSGLAIEVTNLQPDTMHGVQLIVSDIRWWNAEMASYDESSVKSLPLALRGAEELVSGVRTMFVFSHHSSGGSVVRINGFKPDPSRSEVKLKLADTGQWRVDLQLVWDGGVSDKSLDFYWDGQHLPAPLQR